ncbi:hypothetical protein MTR67_001658 [Solanum verrucosum]|uniref:Uncharacterized protein n=1 Tax=Solanum verrucosum TaxID=315347 RepID=A0AAF0T8M4_SOLVR|nr:hypothetical protein MTR67_001658 [Solanum verrucosum]
MAAPHMLPHPFCQKRLQATGKWPISQSNLSNRPKKVDILEIFLLLHDLFAFTTGICVFENSKFEFLEPKSTIKGGLRFSTKSSKN